MQRRTVMSVRKIYPNPSEKQLRKRVAEIHLLEHLFGKDARMFMDLYKDLRDYFITCEETLPNHSLHQFVRKLASGLYFEPAKSVTGKSFATDI